MTKKFYSLTSRLNAFYAVLAILLIVPHGHAQDAMQRAVDARIAEGRNFDGHALFEAQTERSSDVHSKYGIAPESLFEGTVMHPVPAERTAILESLPEFVSLEIPSASGEPLVLQLFRKSPFSPDVILQSGLIDADEFESNTLFYRGVVQGYLGSLASVTVTGDEIRAMVAFKGTTYVLGKIEGADDGAHIFYRADDLALPENFSCEVRDEHEKDEPADSMVSEASDRTEKCVRLRVEIDNGLVSSLGGEAPAVTYAAGLWNEVTTLYDNDGIDLTISEIFAWVGSSPYSGSLANRLNQVSNSSPNADLTALITNVGGGGIAYLSTVCSANFGTSVSNVHGFYQSVPTYSWDVQVCAHEIGHNLSSRHTHACVWNGNNTPLDGCGIAAGYLEGSCGTAPIPSNGGTIMSYCHLSSAGISFTQGFGAQPSTRMINYVNSRACLGASCTPFGGTVCEDELVTLQIVADALPAAVHWEVANASGQVVRTGGPYSGMSVGSSVTREICVPAGCHTMTVFAEFGNISYSITAADGTVFAAGEDFEVSETSAICFGDPSAKVNCASPYPKIQNLTAAVQTAGVMLYWTPIPGSRGCQIEGGRSNSSSLTLLEVLEDDMSSYLIPASQLPVNGDYRVRLRCGCDRGPLVAGDWTKFLQFSWNNAGNTPPAAQGLFTDNQISASAFPNPTAGEISLSVSSGAEEALMLRIFDLPGRLVHSERIQAAAGDNLFRLDLSNLGEAVYLLQLTGGEGNVHTSRIAVAK